MESMPTPAESVWKCVAIQILLFKVTNDQNVCISASRVAFISLNSYVFYTVYKQAPLLLTWFNFNPSMNK